MFFIGQGGRRREGGCYIMIQFSISHFFSNQGERLCFSSGKEGVGGGGMLCKNSIFNF